MAVPALAPAVPFWFPLGLVLTFALASVRELARFCLALGTVLELAAPSQQVMCFLEPATHSPLPLHAPKITNASGARSVPERVDPPPY